MVSFTSRVKSFGSAVGAIMLGLLIVGAGVMLLGFGIMFFGYLSYVMIDFINTNIFHLGSLGITGLQYTLLAFRVGLLLLLGPFGLLVWTASAFWNPVFQGIYDSLNFAISIIWGIFSYQKTNTYGFTETVYIFGTPPHLIYTDADTTNWVNNYIQIGTFIQNILLPQVPACFWVDPNSCTSADYSSVSSSTTGFILPTLQSQFYKIYFLIKLHLV